MRINRGEGRGREKKGVCIELVSLGKKNVTKKGEWQCMSFVIPVFLMEASSVKNCCNAVPKGRSSRNLH